jgi:hypothetical protein
MSTKKSPPRNTRHPCQAGSGRPSRPAGNCVATTRSLTEIRATAAQIRSPATAAARFTSGTVAGR